jgi:tyrosine-protein phosphatase SIW14
MTRAPALALLILLVSAQAPAQASSPDSPEGGTLPSIRGFGSVGPRIFRGSAPALPEDFELLRGYGVQTIVNLRRYIPWEIEREAELARRHGLRHIHIPIHSWAVPSKESVEAAVAELADTRNGIVYVHCKRGIDRTGIVVAYYRVRHDGWSPSEAYAEMSHYGFEAYIAGIFWFFRKWLHSPHGEPARIAGALAR